MNVRFIIILYEITKEKKTANDYFLTAQKQII